MFSETLNIVSRKLGRDKAITTGELLLATASFAVVESDEEIRSDAFALFQKLPPSVSFTDCMVMAFATSYGTQDIFGFDACFADNG